LSQTRKVTQFPIVLFGSEYWTPMLTWLKDTVLPGGYISDDDLDMLRVTDSVEDAVQMMLTPVPPLPPRDPN
jgi:predicted Rossmann-fold nucleotide-binding protein